MNIFQLEERLNENPDSPLSARLAAQYLIRGKIEEAVSLSLRCIEQNPDYATPYIILGRCYASIQCYKEAILCSKKAISIQPDSLILRNLILSWEKLSLKENIESKNEFSKLLPDYQTLQTALFKKLALIDSSATGQNEVPEPSENLNMTEEIPIDNLDIERKPELEVEVQSQKIEPVITELIVDVAKPQEEEILMEVVEQSDMNLPPMIETVLKSIDFESSKPEDISNQQSVSVEEKEGKIAQTGDIEEPKESLKISELKTEQEILGQTAGEEDLKKHSAANKPEESAEISKIRTQEFQKETYISPNENTEEFSEDVKPAVCEGKSEDFDVSIHSSNMSIEISKSSEIQSTIVHQVVDTDKDFMEDSSKKSDEHIAKIFESAHETVKKEPVSDRAEFNHGPVSELPQIVSVTLAEIYVRQGEFEEAIKTYRALIQLRPKQKQFFEKKIEELEKKLKSQL